MLVKGPISWSWSGHLLQQRIKVASGHTWKLVGSVFSQLNQLHRTTLTGLKLWKWTSSKQCRLLEIFCLWYAARDHEFLWHSFPVMNLMKCNVQASSETKKPPNSCPFFPTCCPPSPTEPLLNWNATQGCTADITSSVGVGELLLWQFLAARWRCKCCCKTSMRKDPSICGPIMKDPKDGFSKKIPVALSRPPFQKDS